MLDALYHNITNRLNTGILILDSDFNIVMWNRFLEVHANKKDNEFTTPLFLYKAGITAMELKEFDKATSLFTKIKDNYPTSDQGLNVDKFINAAKYSEQ
mgnify:CR=1 FL=1